MKTNKLKKISLIIGLAVILGFFGYYSHNALASGAWDAQIGSENNTIGSWFGSSGGSGDLVSIIINLINMLLALLALIFVVLLIIGGFTWMTSGGDPAKVKTAQAYIKNATIGLVVILAAKGVMFFVFNVILRSQGVLMP